MSDQVVGSAVILIAALGMFLNSQTMERYRAAVRNRRPRS